MTQGHTQTGRSTTTEPRRKRRSRPTPKWLLEAKEVDELARRRCLLVLSVLSGERPVTDVIEEAGIARGTYYQLEAKALEAMIAALAPGAPTDGTSPAHGAAQRIAALEEKVAKLEQEKRRAERLLLLTRKVVRPGPVKTTAGRPRKTAPGSKRAGPKPSTGSARKATSPSSHPSASASTPTPAGTDGR